MNSALRYALAAAVGGVLFDVLMRTLRWHVDNEDMYQRFTRDGRPVIFVLWHGRLLPLGFRHRNQRIVGLASRSADGEYIARLLRHWGVGVIRGSSSSGGDSAFREMVRTIRSGSSIAVTPDGPRGPRQQLKPGVVQLAQITGAPIVAIGAAASRAWWFESWDRFLIPQPCARVYVDYGEPVVVPRTATSAQLEAIVNGLERALNALTDRVDQRALP
ncbi:MAG TPA: lysophospholipid acyltransferase family protein [Longimicrobiales bacterium]|nr:lysophospholipid acyltransferase family protein [Longimicrobiales bacterium]